MTVKVAPNGKSLGLASVSRSSGIQSVDQLATIALMIDDIPQYNCVRLTAVIDDYPENNAVLIVPESYVVTGADRLYSNIRYLLGNTPLSLEIVRDSVDINLEFRFKHPNSLLNGVYVSFHTQSLYDAISKAFPMVFGRSLSSFEIVESLSVLVFWECASLAFRGLD